MANTILDPESEVIICYIIYSATWAQEKACC